LLILYRTALERPDPWGSHDMPPFWQSVSMKCRQICSGNSSSSLGSSHHCDAAYMPRSSTLKWESIRRRASCRLHAKAQRFAHVNHGERLAALIANGSRRCLDPMNEPPGASRNGLRLQLRARHGARCSREAPVTPVPGPVAAAEARPSVCLGRPRARRLKDDRRPVACQDEKPRRRIKPARLLTPCRPPGNPQRSRS
jgi:hypothetical protein